ncbi:MAG: ABC transporter permease [Candidatus Dormibacteraeota bacterium]|nr:ABC transporter permease [Candidatus Dormibacteraeota bacterium]
MSLGVTSATPATEQPEERSPSRGVGSLLGKIVRSYAFNRIWRALLTIYVVITLTFFLVREMPGSPIEVYIHNLINQYGMSYPDALARAQALFQFNPNEPLIQQYWTYLGNLAHGNLGQSFLSPGTSVTSIIASYLPWTLFSVGLGLLTSFILGVALGMIMAYKRESILDHSLSVIGSFFHSVPNYILGMLIVVLLGIQLGLFSVADMRGSYSAGIQPGLTPAFLGDALYHAALPIATYVLTTIGGWMLIMKSSTVATLEEDYVTVARARGLRDGRIVTAYVGRNAILPLFAQLAISIGFVVGGSLLVEWLFQYQGIGLALYNAIYMRDYTVMQGIFLVLTVSIVAANLVADLLYGRLDPRVRINRPQ